MGPDAPPLSRPGQPVGGLEGSCELGPAVKLRQQRVPPPAPSRWRTPVGAVTEDSRLQTPPRLQQPRPATALPLPGTTWAAARYNHSFSH